jgi:histidinol-phosphate aminotransferase
MSNSINRRSLLKKGLLSLGGIALAPHITQGAFSGKAFPLDKHNRLYYSPMAREYFIEGMTIEPEMRAKLNANENPYGPPMTARKAVADAVSGGNRYAWKELMELVDKIAKKENVTPKHIMMGPGSSDLLEKVAIVLLKDGGNVVSADPTYMSLIKVAESVGASWKAVPCKGDWAHDLDAMEKAIDSETKLVYICNPNNPMGAMTPAEELMAFCSRASEKVPVFVDEAYIELAYGPEAKSMVSLLGQNKNVVIARTFSKIMGMAGLRIGYIAALPSFIDKIGDITRGGMGIAFTSVHAAIAAMDDANFQGDTKVKNEAAKKYTMKELTAMGFEPVPSFTNFIIFPIQWEGKAYLKKMYDQGVGVRAFNIADKDWCRVSMGTMDEMKTFISALKSIS